MAEQTITVEAHTLEEARELAQGQVPHGLSLLAALGDPAHQVRARAAGALSHAASVPEVLCALLTALHDPAKSVRSTAALALEQVVSRPEVLSALLGAMRDQSEDVRSNAAYILGHSVSQPEAIPALLTALRDPSDYVRVCAAGAPATIVRKPGDAVRPSLAAELAAGFDVPRVDEIFGLQPQDYLFAALWRVAAGPQVK